MTEKSPGTRLSESEPAKFFFAVAGGEKRYLPEVEDLLLAELGSVEFRSKIYCFSDFSRYYDRETGGRVWKYLFSVREMMPPETLVKVKLHSEQIQQQFLSERHGRTCRDVNIDPGYLNGWQVILSSVKNFTHRIYLEKGVYAETTLLYQKGDFQSLPWTYADYLSEPVLAFLNDARQSWSRLKGTAGN